MCECTNGCCSDPEMAETRHGLSRREKLARDPDYGDYMYGLIQDEIVDRHPSNRRVEKEMDREGKGNG